MPPWARIALGTLVLSTGACSDGTDPVANPLDFSGEYTGWVTGAIAGADSTLTITITQSELNWAHDRITGTWESGGASGSIFGTAGDPGFEDGMPYRPDVFSFEVRLASPCPDTLVASGYASETADVLLEIGGGYSGPYCGGNAQGTWKVGRM